MPMRVRQRWLANRVMGVGVGLEPVQGLMGVGPCWRQEAERLVRAGAIGGSGASQSCCLRPLFALEALAVPDVVWWGSGVGCQPAAQVGRALEVEQGVGQGFQLFHW